jgi:hypothetical protein
MRRRKLLVVLAVLAATVACLAVMAGSGRAMAARNHAR